MEPGHRALELRAPWHESYPVSPAGGSAGRESGRTGEWWLSAIAADYLKGTSERPSKHSGCKAWLNFEMSGLT